MIPAKKRVLEKGLTGRTSLLVAHWLSTVSEASQSLVINDEGKIRERGTYNELLDANGLCAELYRTKFAWQQMRSRERCRLSDGRRIPPVNAVRTK